MDFGDHRLQHRRPGWHFNNRDARAHAFAIGVSISRGGHGDLVTAAFPFLLIFDHDQQVAFPGPLAQVVMPHHAIEVERLCGTCVGLNWR